jgi:hypothetical protein
MSIDDPEIKSELDDATRDLRKTLNEINDRVEEGVEKYRPDSGIRKHPLAAACIAGALGFALGSDTAEVSLVGLLLFGAAFVLGRDREDDDHK